jgi:hypothetical protein
VLVTRYVPPVFPHQRLIVIRSVQDRAAVTLQVRRSPGRGSMLVHFQQAFTGAPFSAAAVGDASCDAVRIDTTECLALNDCVPTPGHSYFAEQRRMDGPFYNLPVTLGATTLTNPMCSATGVLTAAVVQGDMPFVTVPRYHAAAVAAPGAAAPATNSATPAWLDSPLNFTAVDARGASRPRQLWLAAQPASEGTVPELSRSDDGANTVHCSIPDVSSFDRVQLNASDNVGQQFAPDCSFAGASLSGASLQAACVADEQCLAIVTTSSGTGLCLLRSGRGVDAFLGQEGRWLMTKASVAERTCTVAVASSGTVTVMLRQTSLAASAAVVFVGTAAAAQCGGLRPFAGGVFGRSSACGTWMTCFEGRVLANDTVRVVYSAAVSAGGCDGSVGALFSARFDAVDQTRAPEPLLPRLLAPESLRVKYPHRLLVKNARRASVNVFVHAAEELLLAVAQTGFDCTRTQRGSCTRPAVQLLVNGLAVQQCGGTLPFLGNVSGTSDQCSQPRFCGMPVVIAINGSSNQTSASDQGSATQSAASSLFADGSSAASGSLLASSAAFTGWVTITVDIASVRFASSLCQHFAATLRASRGYSNGTNGRRNISGFVLYKGRGEFAVLAAPRTGTATANASSTWGQALPLPQLAPLIGLNDPRTLLLINATALASSPSSWQRLGGANASLACVMDWISTDSGVCIFPVPPGANFATIRVSQTNFAPPANVMTISQLDGDGIEVKGTLCGGTLGFSGQGSRSEQCGSFLPCGGGFLDNAAAAIRMIVPAAVGHSGTCTAAFAATIDFSFIDRTVPTVCPFLCSRDRTCVALSAVCNGAADCTDGSDEEKCKAWTQVESNNIFLITADAVVLTIKVFADCRTAALQNGTNIFAVAKNQTICVIDAATRTKQYLTNPTPFIVAMPGFATFAMLEEGTSYGRCTAENSCSSKGSVVETRVAGLLSCSCVCDTGFTGTDCSQRMELGSTGPIAVSFSFAGSEVPTPSSVELALQQLSNSTDVSFSCSPMVRNQGKLSTACTVSGPTADVDSINSAVTDGAARQVVAASLNISSDQLEPMTPSTQPLFQLSPCSANNESGAALACPVGGKPVKSIRASVTASSGVGEIALEIGRSGAQTRRFAQASTLRCVPDNANLFETPTRSGCVTTVCFVTLDDPSPVDSVSVSTPGFAGNASTDACYSTSMEFTVPLLVSDVIKAHPTRSITDYSPFLISCIVVMIVGGVLLGVASFALRQHISESSAAVGDVPADHGLKSLLTTAIRRMKFSHAHNSKKERWSTALGVASFDILILGTFLALYFVNSSGYSSNVQVILEAYRTDSCERSTFAPLAMRATVVSAATARQCKARESTGISSGSIYAAAYCDNSTGTVRIFVKIGSSQSECDAMSFTPFESGACVQTSSLLPLVNDSTYLLLQCGTVSSVGARFAAFQSLNADEPDRDITRPQLPDTSAVTVSRSSGGVFLTARISQGVASNATSTATGRYESAAGGGELLVGDTSPRRLVVQVESEVFDSTTRGAATAALEQASPVKSVSSEVAALGPQDGDYPVGFLFNNFDLPGEAPLFAAGSGAARYYGVRGSSADIGLHYGGGMFDGYTISMYLRCARRTAGFAYAVADAREDTASGLSPLLTRLMAMLANGSPASAWYNSTYNVYSGLFVDGPGMSLHFVYANSAAGATLTDLRWDLASLGLTRLFNGLWHHVAIIIRSENQNTKVQLVVDGETSESKNGWNQCAALTPDPIQAMDTAAEIAVRNFQAERVLVGGVLFAGYFNGGVAHLQFINKKMELFSMWRTATHAIQSHNALDESKNIALGAVLLAIGVMMIAAMLATSGVEWLQTERELQEAAQQHAESLYAELWSRVPKDPKGVPYAPLPFALALECLSCTPKTFAVFLEELQLNFRHPPQELVRLLFAEASAGTGAVNAKIAPPTAEEWQLYADPNGANGADDFSGADSPFDAMTFEEPPAHMASQRPNAMEASVFFGSSDIGRSFRRSNRSMRHKNDQAKRQVKVELKGGNTDMRSGNLTSKVGGGGAKTTAATGSGPSPSEMLQSVLGVIQSVSIWQTSMKFPQSHLMTFQVGFSAFSLDFSSLVSLSPLVTPLVQLFAGLVVFGVLLLVVEADEKAFLWNLARYVVVRDRLDMGSSSDAAVASTRKMDYMSEVDHEFDALLGEVADNGLKFTIPLLPLGQSQMIDDFVSGDKRRALSKVRAIMVHDDSEKKYTLQKPPAARDNCPVSFLYVKSYDTETMPLRPLGHCCSLHSARTLGPQVQTSVWPYKYRPTCCAERHGRRCDESVGLMYVCGEKEEKGGVTVQCKYAVCEKHFRAPASVALMMPLVGMHRAALDRGVLWLVVTIFLVAANAFYTPFMKTALSILACDPFYQCQFTQCWEAPDRLFILAAYLCFVIVIFYGMGFPLCMALLLRRRKHMLHEIFFSDVYEGRFEDPSEAGQVDMEEWRRYVVTDPTALGKLYLSFELDWIYVPPILLFWKAAILAPAVFIERNTFQQSVGIAAVQFLFGVFMFVTEPSISPIVDLMYKLGAAHQMLLLGVLSLNTRQQYVGSTDLGALSVGITATYLVISVAMMAGVTLIPVIQEVLERERITELLARLDMHYSKATGIYIVPSRERKLYTENTEETDAGPQGSHTEECSASEVPVSLLESQLTASSKISPSEVDISAFVRLRRQRTEPNPLQAVHFAAPSGDPKDAQTKPANQHEGVDEVVAFQKDDAFSLASSSDDDLGDAPVVLKDELVSSIVDATQSNDVTPLQRRVILAALRGRDCIAMAPRRVGKSHAAAILALQSVDLAVDAVQIVVACRDAQAAAGFAQQLHRLGSGLSSGTGTFVTVFDGSNRTSADIQSLQKNAKAAKIIVGTVDALSRLVMRNAMRTTSTRHLVLDDADCLLAADPEAVDGDETNAEKVHRLLRQMPKKTQLTMFVCAATEAVKATASMFLRDPVEITPDSRSLASTAPQMLKIQSFARPKVAVEVEESSGSIPAPSSTRRFSCAGPIVAGALDRSSDAELEFETA